MSSYSYPFSISELVEVKKTGNLQVKCKGSIGNLNFQNTYTVVTPVIDNL
jgi:hypothetical protein